MQKRPFPVIATLCTAAGIAVLCGLGTWQLNRLEWKTELLAQVDAEYEKDAASIQLAPRDLEEEFLLRRGTLKGRYEFNKQISWIPRLYAKDSGQDVPGKDIMTPLRLPDGSYILVDRGWAPSGWDIQTEENRPEGIVTITGVVRKLSEKSPFAAANRPEKNQWYSPQPEEHAAYFKEKNVRPYILFREGKDLDGIYPIPNQDRPEIANNHLQYAWFWFSMAATLAAIYIIRFFTKVGLSQD